MDERQSHERYARVAIAILMTGALAEGARLFLAPWPGYSPEASRTLSAIWLVFWVIGALAIYVRRRGRCWANLAWWYAFAAPLSMLAQGSLTRVGGSLLGLPYFAAAAALGFTLKRTFDRERQRHAEQHPDGLPQRH